MGRAASRCSSYEAAVFKELQFMGMINMDEEGPVARLKGDSKVT